MALLFVGVPIGIWSFLVLLSGGSDFVSFATMAVWFIVLACAFLFKCGLGEAQWCSAPVFMTILATVEFVAIPFWRLAIGADQIDSLYTDAMFYVLVGFCMFWLSCWMIIKPRRLTFAPQLSSGPSRILPMAIAMSLVGAISKVVMWRLGFFGYFAYTTDTVGFNISVVELIGLAASMLDMAVLISGIEVLGKHSKSLGMRLIFGTSLVLDLIFGLLSGMKIDFLMPLFYVVILLGITRGRLPRLIWAFPVGLLLLYPFVNAYRANLNSGYSAQANTLSGLTSTLAKSIEDVATGYQGSDQGLQIGFEDTSSRMSALGLFHNVLQLSDPSVLIGDETVWMAPLYPFIPRALWPNKPIMDKGHRLSEAMGNGERSSTNVPGVADMYAMGGIEGILLGMLVWGLCLQAFMNGMGGGLSEKGVFFYVMMLFPLINIERDMVAMIGGAIQSAGIFLVLSKIIYGGRIFSLAPARAERTV